jgi:hypothetical protein
LSRIDTVDRRCHERDEGGDDVKYLLLLYGDEAAEAALTPEERRAIFDAHLRFHTGLRERGELVRGEPLNGRAEAFTVRPGRGGRPIVTDGPFAETKEQLGSYYVVECANREAAEAIAREIPASPGLVVEAWPIAEM